MNVSSYLVAIVALGRGFGLTLLMCGFAEAYVDPGTTGMLSQLLYILFYGALGVFLYCLRYFKQVLADRKHYFAKFFGQKIDIDR
jgi:hypothetical protein